MIFAELVDYSESIWIIALGIIIGLSFAMTIVLQSNYKSFFIFVLIFCSFCFYGGLIDLWIVISFIIINSLIMIIDLKSGSGLIMSTLTVMFILVVFNIIFGGTYIGTTTTLLIDSEVLIDGISATFKIESTQFLFEIDELEGMIILLTTIISIATFAGVNILGSGLSDTSVRTITIVSIFAGIWIILSVLIAPLIWSIEIFGALIYILLTMAYVIGVVQKVVSV